MFVFPTALQRELSSNAKSNDAHDPTDPPGALMGAGAEAAAASRPPSGDEGQWLAQQQHVNSLEALLDDAKMSNRLLSRALSAVQVRRGQVRSGVGGGEDGVRGRVYSRGKVDRYVPFQLQIWHIAAAVLRCRSISQRDM